MSVGCRWHTGFNDLTAAGALQGHTAPQSSEASEVFKRMQYGVVLLRIAASQRNCSNAEAAHCIQATQGTGWGRLLCGEPVLTA